MDGINNAPEKITDLMKVRASRYSPSCRFPPLELPPLPPNKGPLLVIALTFNKLSITLTLHPPHPPLHRQPPPTLPSTP